VEEEGDKDEGQESDDVGERDDQEHAGRLVTLTTGRRPPRAAPAVDGRRTAALQGRRVLSVDAGAD